MSGYIDVGAMRERVEVLECQETGEHVWTWVPVRKTWAGITLTEKSNLFSKVGVGARDAALTVRRQVLSLHNAVQYKGIHYFLTSITERNRNYLDIRAAVCEISTLTAKPKARPGRDEQGRPMAEDRPEITFPGVLTEQYYQHTPDETFKTMTQRRVLVTPKVILLRPGDLVRRGGRETYIVHQTLDLDPYKNEYVMELTETGLLRCLLAYLIDTAATEDSAGYETVTESKTEVFVDVQSVQTEEFSSNRQTGLKPTIVFVLRERDYSGQPRIEFEGKQYNIIRTYTRDEGLLALNCAPYRGETP